MNTKPAADAGVKYLFQSEGFWVQIISWLQLVPLAKLPAAEIVLKIVADARCLSGIGIGQGMVQSHDVLLVQPQVPREY